MIGKEWIAECDSKDCYASLVIPMDRATPTLKAAVDEYRANGWRAVSGPKGYATCPQCVEKIREWRAEQRRQNGGWSED